jgi:hypothetical protein
MADILHASCCEPNPILFALRASVFGRGATTVWFCTHSSTAFPPCFFRGNVRRGHWQAWVVYDGQTEPIWYIILRGPIFKFDPPHLWVAELLFPGAQVSGGGQVSWSGRLIGSLWQCSSGRGHGQSVDICYHDVSLSLSLSPSLLLSLSISSFH